MYMDILVLLVYFDRLVNFYGISKRVHFQKVFHFSGIFLGLNHSVR